MTMPDDPGVDPTAIPPARAGWSRLRWKLNRWKTLILQALAMIVGSLFTMAAPIIEALKDSGVDWTLFFSPQAAGIIILVLAIGTSLLKLFFSDASPLDKPAIPEKD